MRLQHILPLSFMVILASCSSAYRIGQTPDDVYYSPAPPKQEEYVTTDNQQDKDGYAYNNEQNMEDLAIRRGINDPLYRSGFSLSYGYGYNPYDQYGLSLYNPYNYSQYYSGLNAYPYFYNNNYPLYNSFNDPYYGSFYAPYVSGPVYSNAGVNKYYGSSYYNNPRQYNMGVYNPVTPRYTTPRSTINTSAPVRTFTQQPPATTGVGGFVRRVFTPQQSAPANTGRTYNNNNDNNYTPSRQMSTTPSNSGSSSSSSGGGGSAPVRTFRH